MNEKYNESFASPEALVFKGRTLPELPEQYKEPGVSNALIVPYGALPANPFVDEQVKKQQADINAEFHKLFETPPQDMPESFVRLILADYVINENRRQMENYENYMLWPGAVEKELVDDQIQERVELFERGQATIDQILDVATQTDIQSFELGKVTHPFGYRMQYLDDFRTDVKDAIESHGGVVYPSIAPYRSIGILPKVEQRNDGTENGQQEVVGFIVKYKRDFGKVIMPGSDEVIHLIERQIAAYRVDVASGFDQSILSAMHDLAAKYPMRVKWNDVLNPSFKDRLIRTGCKDFIEKAVQTDSLEDFVVPISTTIYGYKEFPARSKHLGDVAIKPRYDDTVAYFGPAFSKDELDVSLRIKE